LIICFKAGSNFGLLLTPNQERGHLKICGTVSKEKGFDKLALPRGGDYKPERNFLALPEQKNRKKKR
jgi:hypothetical protein